MYILKYQYTKLKSFQLCIPTPVSPLPSSSFLFLFFGLLLIGYGYGYGYLADAFDEANGKISDETQQA